MSSATEINNIARRVITVRTAVGGKNNDYRRRAPLIGGRGKIVDASKNVDIRARPKVSSLGTAYGSLNSTLNSMRNAVVRTEMVR